jgi:colanic acid biosynthesis glycosyl transferase WcaI
MFISASWRPDVILCVVPTLFVAPWALLLSRLLKVPAWIHIHDFEVEAAFELGMLSQGSVVQRMLTWFEGCVLKGFHKVSTLSERMLDKLIAKGINKSRTFLLPNWVDLEQIFPTRGKNPLRSRLCIPSDQIVVLYSGNIGFKQGLDILLEAAERLLEKREIIFVICGDGAARDHVQQRAEQLQNVTMIPLQPLEHLNELLNLADIHVLPQQAGVADLVMPSKLGGMLGSGRPIVATADLKTEIGEVVGDVGILVPPGDSKKLSNAIRQLAEDSDLRDRLGALGQQYAKVNLNKEEILLALESEISKF